MSLNYEECMKEMDREELVNTGPTWTTINTPYITNLPYIIENEEKEKEKEDVVNKPSHYTSGKIEVIDFIEDQKLGFCPANAIKYISRAGKKPDAELSREEKAKQDLKKAIWYLERAIGEINRGNIDLVCLK